MRPIEADLADALRRARFIVALTGAGVSAESGVPTFRDAHTGLWARFDPRELATPSAFARQPRVVWDWYAWRRALVAKAQPNAAHRALARLEQRASGFLLVTQNVDGLHARAGSRNLVELHGNLARVKCAREGTIVDTWHDDDPAVPPRCAHCGAFLRPDVVWFDELLPAEALAAAEDAAARADVLLVIGTSAEVYPAAALPQRARASSRSIPNRRRCRRRRTTSCAAPRARSCRRSSMRRGPLRGPLSRRRPRLPRAAGARSTR